MFTTFVGIWFQVLLWFAPWDAVSRLFKRGLSLIFIRFWFRLWWLLRVAFFIIQIGVLRIRLLNKGYLPLLESTLSLGLLFLRVDWTSTKSNELHKWGSWLSGHSSLIRVFFSTLLITQSFLRRLIWIPPICKEISRARSSQLRISLFRFFLSSFGLRSTAGTDSGSVTVAHLFSNCCVHEIVIKIINRY
jgi:hypothetical protein